MPWWGWVTLGIAFLAFEMITPAGFFLFFFGFGALVTGALVGMDLLRPEWLEWIVFTLVSGVSLVFLRGKVVRNMPKTCGSVDSMVGEAATAQEDIPGNGLGKVELRGSSWNAKNSSSQTISKGTRCIVESVEGLTVVVRSN